MSTQPPPTPPMSIVLKFKSDTGKQLYDDMELNAYQSGLIPQVGDLFFIHGDSGGLVEITNRLINTTLDNPTVNLTYKIPD